LRPHLEVSGTRGALQKFGADVVLILKCLFAVKCVGESSEVFFIDGAWAAPECKFFTSEFFTSEFFTIA
jgi:hypothetical protein